MSEQAKTAAYKRMILMNPGPVVTDDRVRNVLALPDMCHREPEFSALMTRVRHKLTLVSGGDSDYSTVVFTGSGTAALEATLSSIVPANGKMVILDNGHYGERLAKICSVHRIPMTVLTAGWGQPLDLKLLERVLHEEPTASHVAMIHHETSTGILNPVHEVGQIVARAGRSLVVDAISSLGGEILDVRNDRIDWCVGTANKCIESVPGLSFVIAPKKRLDALSQNQPRTFYLDLYSQYVAEEKSQAPAFTPAIPTFLALEVALDLLQEEGVRERQERYKSLADLLRCGLRELGLRLLLPDALQSSTLTAIYFPEGRTYSFLHDRLKELGFVIYAGQDNLKQKVFRLANMGQISKQDIQNFLGALAQVLREQSVQRQCQ